MFSFGGIGSLAGGVAAGMAKSKELALQQQQNELQNQYYSGRNENQADRNETYQESVDNRAARAAGKLSGGSGKSRGGGGNTGDDYEAFKATLAPIFSTNAGAAQAPAPAGQPSTPMAIAGGLSPQSPTTLPEVGMLAGNPAGAYQGGGLAAVPSQPAAAAPQGAPEEATNPIHEIVKQIGFGDLANDPQKLNAIRAAAAMHGMGKDINPWLDSLVSAKRSGVFDAAMSLKRGDVDGAMASMKQGGINLEDRPVKVDPNDSNNSKWKVNISGSGEQTIDLDNWATSTLDPEKYGKFLNDRQSVTDKGKVADSQVNQNNAGAQKNAAMAGAYKSGALGRGSAGSTSKAPRVVKTVETNRGMVAVMSDGTQNTLKDENGNPMFGTSAQKVAAGLVGKTIDPSSDGSDVATRVNTMTGQLQGKTPAAPAKLKDIPDGAKMIGTSKGKPVYEVNGKRFIGD